MKSQGDTEGDVKCRLYISLPGYAHLDSITSLFSLINRLLTCIIMLTGMGDDQNIHRCIQDNNTGYRNDTDLESFYLVQRPELALISLSECESEVTVMRLS